MEPVYVWWNQFKGVVGNYFTNLGPSEYGQILVITFICGYLWLRSGR